MDSKAWNSQKGSDKLKTLLRSAGLSLALAQASWASLTKAEKMKIERASKGSQGWREEKAEVPTKEGIKKVAPRHREVAVKKALENTERVPMVAPDVKIPYSIDTESVLGKRLLAKEARDSEKIAKLSEALVPKNEVPEPDGYFTLKKAQNLVKENPKQLSDEHLQKKIIQARDYINFIVLPDEYSVKTLVKGGYFCGIEDHSGVTGMVPVDKFLYTNLTYIRDEFYKEQDRRKAEKEAIHTQAQKEPWEMTKKDYRDTNPTLIKASEKLESLRQALGSDNRWGDTRRFQGKRDGLKVDRVRKAEERWSMVWNNVEKSHKGFVMEAIKHGKPVPSEVLADYPDLKEEKSPAPPKEEKIRDTKITHVLYQGATYREAIEDSVSNMEVELKGGRGEYKGEKYKDGTPKSDPTGKAEFWLESSHEGRTIKLPLNRAEVDYYNKLKSEYKRPEPTKETLEWERKRGIGGTPELKGYSLPDPAYRYFDPAWEKSVEERMKEEAKREENPDDYYRDYETEIDDWYSGDEQDRSEVAHAIDPHEEDEFKAIIIEALEAGVLKPGDYTAQLRAFKESRHPEQIKEELKKRIREAKRESGCKWMKKTEMTGHTK